MLPIESGEAYDVGSLAQRGGGETWKTPFLKDTIYKKLTFTG